MKIGTSGSRSVTRQNVLQKTPAVSTVEQRHPVKLLQVAREVHQAVFVVAVNQIEEMTQFVQGDFSDSFVNNGLSWYQSVGHCRHSEDRNNSSTAVLTCFAEDVCENRNTKVDSGDTDQFMTVNRYRVFKCA
jgi:hypothetical protein